MSPESAPLHERLLTAFAASTGLTSGGTPRRYLWTDAFAVCGFLGLYRSTGEARHLETARKLVDQVHDVLGRHRPDDSRTGWISGLDEEEGRRRPTAGGLRIGKPEPERGPGEPHDPRREWDRDGQYYHYLTRWMVALQRMTAVTGEPHFHRWAVELAEVAHRAFLPPGGPRPDRHMYWKMNIALDRPLVPSMGQHDPLDGRLTVGLLQVTAPSDRGESEGTDADRSSSADAPGEPILQAEAAELEEICRGRSWTTDDPLGAGGLLTDCLRLVQLSRAPRRPRPPVAAGLRERVFQAARESLERCAGDASLDLPGTRRLAFRELGLAIGIRAVERIDARTSGAEGGDIPAGWVRSAGGHAGLADRIVEFWSRTEARSLGSWTDHHDINDVMLAVALAPTGYLATDAGEPTNADGFTAPDRA